MRNKIIVGVLLTGALFLYYRYGMRHARMEDAKTGATVLAPDDNEKIVVDPDKHTISITTQKGTTTEFLPSRPSSIELKKGGDVIVTARQYGIETVFFAGGGVSNDGLRVAIGTDLWYFKRLDIGTFVSDSTKDLTKLRIGVNLSYSVWHDTRLTLGLDNTGTPELLITERF